MESFFSTGDPVKDMQTFKNTLYNASIRALKPDEEAKLRAAAKQQKETPKSTPKTQTETQLKDDPLLTKTTSNETGNNNSNNNSNSSTSSEDQ